MIRPPPGFTPPDTLLPSTTVFRSQSAGPECADQIPCLRAHAVDEPVDGVPRSDQYRDGHVSPACLGAQQTRDRFAVERVRSEEHTSELQSIMRISHAGLRSNKKKKTKNKK